ncbi:MAG: rod shape-determining protein MreC [Brevinematia bacterium]
MDGKYTKQSSPIMTYSIVVVVCVLLLIFNSINYYISFSIKFVGNVILYPVVFLSQVSSKVANSFVNAWENFTRSIDKISRLEKELEELKKKAALVEYYETENRKLSILLNVSQVVPYTVEIADIISGGFDSVDETIIVNKGMVNGITKNMPVIAYQGGKLSLIGVVKEAFFTTSVVETIVSPNINVGVMLETSQEVGILSGDGKINGTSTVRYISESTDVKVGTEKVYTFSRSMFYPPGILIGTVISSKKRERSRFQELTVKPAIDVKNISTVMIIKSR